MAQKKIDIRLTSTEVAHLTETIRVANEKHAKDLGRTNTALDRVLKKLDKAEALADAEDLEPVKDEVVDGGE